MVSYSHRGFIFFGIYNVHQRASSAGHYVNNSGHAGAIISRILWHRVPHKFIHKHLLHSSTDFNDRRYKVCGSRHRRPIEKSDCGVSPLCESDSFFLRRVPKHPGRVTSRWYRTWMPPLSLSLTRPIQSFAIVALRPQSRTKTPSPITILRPFLQ
jgi:hypothetical protein